MVIISTLWLSTSANGTSTISQGTAPICIGIASKDRTVGSGISAGRRPAIRDKVVRGTLQVAECILQCGPELIGGLCVELRKNTDGTRKVRASLRG